METGKLELKDLFVGERLCLDFINTACRRREEELEFLGTVEEAEKWLQYAEGVHNKPIYNAGVWQGEDSGKSLSQAIRLRIALRELVLAVIEKRSAPVSAIEAVNTVLQSSPTYCQLTLAPDGYRESVHAKDTDSMWLASIAADAVGLLCRSDLTLLRQCEHPTCVRIFYDTTKNHRRRWCVEKCGSHKKAAAYYRRKVAKNRLEKGRNETKRS